jgi:hypothetical protein
MAAAWAGVSSSACTVTTLQHRAVAQTVTLNLEICMGIFYANLPTDATAFTLKTVFETNKPHFDADKHA